MSQITQIPQITQIAHLPRIEVHHRHHVQGARILIVIGAELQVGEDLRSKDSGGFRRIGAVWGGFRQFQKKAEIILSDKRLCRDGCETSPGGLV
jgi:hypothetical protein